LSFLLFKINAFKLKQESAVSCIKNVLLTIYYDTKIEYEFKEKQISTGEKAIESIKGVVPFVNNFFLIFQIFLCLIKI
jgi:hypothetical protein